MLGVEEQVERSEGPRQSWGDISHGFTQPRLTLCSEGVCVPLTAGESAKAEVATQILG